jgi:hypothetical protein
MVCRVLIGITKSALLISCSIGLTLFSGLSVSAQQIELKPEIKHPERFDVSRPLAQYKTPPLQILIEREDLLRIPVPPSTNQADPAVQNSVSAPLTAIPGLGFDGVGANGSAPPDTNMAVGPNHIVQWVNTQFAVFDKLGNTLLGPMPGNTLWSGFGGPCETKNDGDPIAQYDQQADRWVMSQLANTSGPTYYQCFAVSTTNNPSGSYTRYAYTFTNSLNDYPKIGIWPSGYFASYNMFAFGFFFQGAQACAYDRSQMLAGGPATSVCFQLSSSFGGLLPSDLDGATPPPSGSPDFFVNFGTNSLNLWKFTPNFVTPSTSTFTGPTNIPVDAFSAACNGGTCIPQSETTQQLDSLADRLMYRLAYRNFGDHESLVVNHAVTAGISVGERWYEIRSPNGTPAIYQQSTFAPDSNFRWMGSAAMDQVGNMAIGYSVSSSSMHPAIRYTGRETIDPLNTLQTETSLIEGTGSQLTNLSRWGDYSALRIDPSDDCTFWFTTEYLKANGTFNWSTRIGSFKFATCGLPADPPLFPTDLKANAVSSSQINLTWTDNSDNESGFKIERCMGDSVSCDTTPTSYAQIAQVGANTTTYSDTTVAASTTYTYRVHAFNGAGNSLNSNSAQAATPAPPSAPAAPDNLTATAVSTSQINLTWTDNSDNEDGFKIERCTVGAGCPNFVQIAQTAAGANSFNNIGLMDGTTYRYRVRAFNSGGDSGYSNEASATTPVAPPSNLTATAGKTGNNVFIDLRWQDNSNSETNFDVERCTGASCTLFLPLTSVGSGVTTYRDSIVARRTTYRYQVKARNGAGSSGYSNIASATTK